MTAAGLLLLLQMLAPAAAGRGKSPAVAAAAGLAPPGRSAASRQPSISRAAHAIDPATFRLAVTRVVVDAGHGGDDPGAVASDLREKDLTLDIARRVEAALMAEAFDVVMTRRADRKVSLQQRVQAANDARADLFLSIHVNSIPMPLRRGVETYVLGATSDPRVAELSGSENSGSGYSLADFRTLLEGVLLDVRHEESHRLGQSVQRRMYNALRPSNPTLEDRGVKQAPFVVLVGTEMPAVLAEVACLSSAEDGALLADEAYRQRIAEALAAGVRDYSASCSRSADGPRRLRAGE